MGVRERYLETSIALIPSRKMVFLGGPRQVGKTTLALSLLGKDADETHPAYYNWGGSPAAVGGSPESAAARPGRDPQVCALAKSGEGDLRHTEVPVPHPPAFAVECKSGERAVSPAIGYFAERTSIPRFFRVHLGDRHFETGAVTVLPFRTFCRELNLA